jgi:hypothetical protein
VDLVGRRHETAGRRPTPTDLRPGLQARITELVLLLDPLETYWAYPGRGQLQQIGALCDTGDYESAMRLTDAVSRQLSGRDDPTGRPVFQVLVVDDVPTPEAAGEWHQRWPPRWCSMPSSRRSGPVNKKV